MHSVRSQFDTQADSVPQLCPCLVLQWDLHPAQSPADAELVTAAGEEKAKRLPMSTIRVLVMIRNLPAAQVQQHTGGDHSRARPSELPLSIGVLHHFSLYRIFERETCELHHVSAHLF